MDRYDFSNIKILVADDSKVVRRILISLFKSMNVGSVVGAENGEEALALLSEEPFDLAVLDWEMRPVTGYDVAANIRFDRTSRNRHMPIIMLTGYTERLRVEAARDIGVNEIMAKPVSGSSMVARLVSMIEHPRAFVEAPSFAGPDRRRRRRDPAHQGPWARRDDLLATAGETRIQTGRHLAGA